MASYYAQKEDEALFQEFPISKLNKTFKHLLVASFIASALPGSSAWANLASPPNLAYTTQTQQSSHTQTERYQLGVNTLHGYDQIKSLKQGLKLIGQSAKQGHLTAQLFLAHYALTEQQDPSKALTWFKYAAKQGDLNAQLYCSAAYLYGYGANKSHAQARKYLILAAKQKNAKAEYTLAVQYLQSRYRKTRRLGLAWLKRAAKQSYQPAKQLLSKISTRKSLKVKAKKANQTAKQLAWQWLGKSFTEQLSAKPLLANWQNNKKTRPGSYNLAPQFVLISRSQVFDNSTDLTNPKQIKVAEFIDLLGKQAYQQKHQFTVPPNTIPPTQTPEQRFQKTLTEAHHGHPKAQVLLGKLYEQGNGTTQNFAKALHWYQKASQQNSSKADYQLGLLYFQGHGVKKDYKTALYWLEKAAFKGNTSAQFFLAQLHEHGHWDTDFFNQVSKDLNYASGMYHLAASGEHPQAQFNLARLYAAGLLGKADTPKSKQARYQTTLALYQSASEQGNQQAELALAYYLVDHNTPDKQQWAFNTAQQAAEAGKPDAAFLLGLLYDRGIGTAADQQKAIYWYQQAAKQNNPIAEFILGTYYYLGEGVSKDEFKATNLLSSAANSDFLYADYNLALIQYHRDYKGYYQIRMKKAATAGFTKAKLFLANNTLLYSANNTAINQAAQTYLQLARQGYPSAQLGAGYLYQTSTIFKGSLKKAGYWYQKAAEQDNVLAQYLLGNNYRLRASNQQDIKQAIKWYQAAEQQHFVAADVALGVMAERYQHHYQAAHDWYLKAAQQGVAQGQYDLGLLFEYGKGTPVDLNKAYHWLLQAANQGYAPAEYNIGMFYLDSLAPKKHQLAHFIAPSVMIQQTDEQAIKWLRKAAQKHFPYAYYQLGLLNEAGVGSPISLPTAKRYYQQAADKGLVKAQQALARLYTQNTPSDEQQASQSAEDTKSSDKTTTAVFNPADQSPSPNHIYMRAIDYANSDNFPQAQATLSYLKQKFPHFKTVNTLS